MSISQLDGGSAPKSLLTRLKEANLSPADAVLQEQEGIKLKSGSATELAGLREFRSQVMDDIGQAQEAPAGGFFGSTNPIGGPPPLPEGPPDYSKADPQAILRSQDPEGYVAFSRLDHDAQQAFLQLVRNVGFEPPPRMGGFGGLIGGMLKGMGGSVQGSATNPCQPSGGQPAQPRINQSLINLLKSGKLSKKDSQGHTILQTLTTLSTQEMGPNLDRKQIFDQLVAELDDPGHINQGTQGTCAPTTIQYLLATRDPAEYARIITGLTSKDGAVTMRNGDTLQRDRGSLGPDRTGRTDIDRIFQAATMEYADGDDEYDNRTDKHTRADDSVYSGLYPEQQERALDALFGDKYDKVDFDRNTPQGRSEAERRLRQALDRGEQVAVSMYWSDTGTHAVLVVGMTDSTVMIRNPWGSGDSGSSTNGPPRQVVDGEGTIEMTKADFFQRCYSMQLPKGNN